MQNGTASAFSTPVPWRVSPTTPWRCGPVQVIYIDLGGSRPVFEKIRLQSAPPGEDVLDRSMQAEASFREERLAGYLAEIKAAGSYQRADVRLLVEEIARSEQLEPRIRSEALRRVGLAEEALARGEGES